MNPESPTVLPVMGIIAETTTHFTALWKRARVSAKALTQRLHLHLQILAAPLLEVARAASSIFLCGSWKTGALLCAALLFMPRYLVFAASACLFGSFITRLLHLPAAMRQDGTLLYNVFLSALAVAWITRGSNLAALAIWGMLAVVTIYTLLLSAALWHWFPLRAGLPPLSIAFVVAFGTLLTFFPHWAAGTALLDMGLPDEPALSFVITAFLRSMGTILFLPNVWAGIAVTLAIFVWSRIAMINAIVGYAGGILIVKLLEACGLQWLGWFAGHNYLLAGMSLGAVYFVPSWSSLVLAAVAGAVAALHVAAVQHLLRGSGWEYLPLPYLLTVWSMLCCLRLREQSGSLLPATGIFDSPEAAAAAVALANARFPHRHETHVLLPTNREVTVTQGFDGKLSHRGDWKHALDLEVHDASDNACPSGCDEDLSRYYTQGLEVRAPGTGEIIRVIDGVADNAPGGCNFANNWGNHLVLRLDYGGIVKLAHFMKNGILVKMGQRVGAGDLLGYCGNSGRSPVPHIHLHNQATIEVGAPTSPFCLTNFFERTNDRLRWNFASVPKVGARIAPAMVSTTVLGTLAHFAPGVATYRVCHAGSTSSETITTTLDESGHYRFQSGKESLTAVLGLHALQITQSSLSGCSQLMRLISFAMPTVPFAYQSGMNWEDCVALQPKQRGRVLAGAFAPYVGHRTQRVISHHSLHPTTQRLQLTTTITDASVDVPKEIEFTLEPIRGLTHLTAHFKTHDISFTQTSFTPTLPNGDVE